MDHLFDAIFSFDNILLSLIIIAVIAVFVLKSIVVIVPQNHAYIVERLGKYNSTLEAGLHLIIPFIDRIAYKHTLKEIAVDVPSQQAITKDNVGLRLDGVLYFKIVDPKAASYGVENLMFAITQIAQTTMRAEIGKLSLDDTFESRENINTHVMEAVDMASDPWGTKILRYEVKDIHPPASILEEMEKQMSAERERRVAVTTSEGYRTAQINRAEGDKEAAILRAMGQAEAVKVEAEARAEAIQKIATAIQQEGGDSSVAQQLAEQYLGAFEKLAKEGTVVLMPSDASDVASIVTKAFTAFKGIEGKIQTS